MKYFRFHRGGYKESIATMRKVSDLSEIKRMILYDYPYAHNIHISRTKYCDTRPPKGWGDTTHYVLADFGSCGSQCVGMCNFYEE